MRRVALFLVLAASPLIGQTAKVIQLSPEDAAQAKSLYAQKAEIEKKLLELKDSVRVRYLTQEVVNHHCYVIGVTGDPERPCKGDEGYKDKQTLPAFYGGFEFSEDFLFVVPASQPTPPVATNNCCYGSNWWNCNNFYTVSPATGTTNFNNGNFSTTN